MHFTIEKLFSGHNMIIGKSVPTAQKRLQFCILRRELLSILVLILFIPFLLSTYWSSFLDAITDICNFNYLVPKISSEEKSILSSMLQQIAGILDQLLPDSGTLRVLRQTAHLDLKVTDYRSEGFCHQSFKCFVFVQFIFHLYSFSIFSP